MPNVDQEEIRTGVFYSHHPDHRNNSVNKSQWEISKEQEKECFIHVIEQTWIINNVGWGFHFHDNIISYLGKAQDHRTLVFIAKFVDGTNSNIWHGYPSDHQQNQADIPLRPILQCWLNNNILNRAKIRKISKGQPCNL